MKVTGSGSAAVSSDYPSAVTVLTFPLIDTKVLSGLLPTSEKSFQTKVGPVVAWWWTKQKRLIHQLSLGRAQGLTMMGAVSHPP